MLVRCYTNLPCAELFLNGRSLGKKEGLNEHGSMDWIVPFEAGELSVKGYPEAKAGQENPELLTFQLATSGEPERLLLNRWAAPGTAAAGQEASLKEGGRPVRVEQIEITLADRDGNAVVHKDLPVRVSVSGAGVLLGLENGNLADNTPYSEPVRTTLQGRLIAYVRRTKEGSVSVSVQADGCGEAVILLPED